MLSELPQPRRLAALARQVFGDQLPGTPSGLIAEKQERVDKPLLLCDGLLEWIDRRRWWLWGFMLLMYAAGFNGQWRIQPDAALYLSLGRNMAEGQGYTYLGQHNSLAYPGWPALIAVVFKLFGSQSLVPVNVVATLIALLTVGAVYRLFLLHCGRPTAVAISVGVGLTKAFYCYGFELWTDMPFALGAISFLAGYEGILTRRDRAFTTHRKLRRRLIDSIFLIGGLLIALVTRPTVWPLLLAAGCGMPVDAIRGRIRLRSVLAIFGVVLIVAIAVTLSHHDFGAGYRQYLINNFTGAHRGEMFSSILRNVRVLLTLAATDVLFQVRLGWFFNTLLSLIVLSLGVGLFRHRSIWGFWFCLLLGTILISQTALDRYFLPVLPLLVYAWWNALVRINRALPVPWGNVLFLGLLGFGSLMNFTKICGIIVQQHERPFLSAYDQGRYEVLPEFSRQLAAHITPDAIVLVRSPYGRAAAFLSRRQVESPVDVSPPQAVAHPIYLVEIEPLDPHAPRHDPLAIQFLRNANLTEGPALFTVVPSPQCAPGGVTMSLHATRAR